MTIHHESGRIDKALTNLFTDYSHSQIQLWLKNGAVSVNGQPVKANYKIKQENKITVLIPEPETSDVVLGNILLTVVYEDGNVAVINRPQGMVTHPSVGHMRGTMVNALVCHVKDLSTINGIIRPSIIHRIDKDTSGLLTVAKNDQAHEPLAQQLKDKISLCKYVALAHGEIPREKGTINAPTSRPEKNRKMQVIKEDGKSAITHSTVLKRFEGLTLVESKLETERTHQIRVHVKYIGCPLVGDPVHGPKKTLRGDGQFLHAQTLDSMHPTTNGKMIFEVPLLEVFEKTLEKLRKNTTF